MQAYQLTELEELECIYCEMHKDVYGVKARWYRAESVEQARKDIEDLSRQAEEVFAQEKRNQEAAAVRFERLVNDTIASGAKDRATALRWIHTAHNTNGDNNFLEYELGLRYGYIK